MTSGKLVDRTEMDDMSCSNNVGSQIFFFGKKYGRVYRLFHPKKHPFGLQGFVTDHERALEELFGENAELSQNYNACINTMATRIATVFASLRVISLSLSRPPLSLSLCSCLYMYVFQRKDLNSTHTAILI